MSYSEHLLPVADGVLSIIDHGGQGPDVLLVHSLGRSAPHWNTLARSLRPWSHPYALDLRGHGHSTAPLTDPAQPWQDIIHVTRELGLHQPILVGHDIGAFYVVAAAVAEPGLFSAIVPIGGMVAREPEEIADILELMSSPLMAESLQERFHLGVSGHGERAHRSFLDAALAGAVDDWVTSHFSDWRAELEWSTRHQPDGSWQILPTTQTVTTGYSLAPEAELYPGPHLCPRVQTPTWLILPRDGYDVDVMDKVRDMLTHSATLRLVEMEGGQYPQCTEPQLLAAQLATVADTVAQLVPFPSSGARQPRIA